MERLRERIVMAALMAATVLMIGLFMVGDHVANVVALYGLSRNTIAARGAPEGAFVYATGIPAIEVAAVDPITGVGSEAVALRREGRIFQWVEYKRLVGKVAVPDHTQKWAPSSVDVSKFGREGRLKGLSNVGALSLTDNLFDGRATLGGLTVSHQILARLPERWIDRLLSVDEFERIPEGVRSDLSLVDGVLSRGEEGDNGAVRVSYRTVAPREMSLVGVARQGRIEPFLINREDAALVTEGKRSLNEMLWDRAWPSLLRVLIAAFVCIAFLVQPLILVYEVVVGGGKPETVPLQEG